VRMGEKLVAVSTAFPLLCSEEGVETPSAQVLNRHAPKGQSLEAELKSLVAGHVAKRLLIGRSKKLIPQPQPAAQL